MVLWCLLCLVVLTGQTLFAAEVLKQPAARRWDVVVYGATSGGVTAAVQAARMGKSVLLIEQGRHIGGLTSGGLGATDIGNKAAIGGLSRLFYRRIGEHYADERSWKYEKRAAYRSRRVSKRRKEMWTFEPHVAEEVFRQMLDESRVPVLFSEHLERKRGVEKAGTQIVSIRMESGLTIQGRVFIDATYEGDLMAAAGVRYHVGREANRTYGETLNGVQTKNAVHHQFIKRVDPYVKPGEPASGLLPGIEKIRPEQDGTGDHRVQTYCFRMCTTDVPENRLPWVKPADYNPLRYELLLRNFEAGDHRVPWNPVLMPNRKTDTNNNYAVSTDNIGMNFDYPDGDYPLRQRIFKEHLSYQQGLMWTLANSPRVPAEVRKHFQTWRPAKDEFTDHGGWPHQLYVREARRMISDYVMTQHDCLGQRVADDSIALAAYTMDSHNIRRYVRDGRVLNEGDVQVGGFAPYPIAYRSLRPKKEECTNLLVPVCLSASHIAYGSIRMEPVFMVLGQSAATAACLAIDEKVAVQDIDISKLTARLKADGQILEWTGPRPKSPIDPAALKGVVVDDVDAELTGRWSRSRSIGGYVGNSYRHDGNENKGVLKAVFRPLLKQSGRYEVRVYFTPSSNRATNVPVTIASADGVRTVHIDQKKKPGSGGYLKVGTFRFESGQKASVTISNASTDGYVVVDAVQFVGVGD